MDGAGHNLVTAYAALRPDGQWSLMVVNKDQENSHEVSIAFDGAKTGSGTASGFAVKSMSSVLAPHNIKGTRHRPVVMPIQMAHRCAQP